LIGDDVDAIVGEFRDKVPLIHVNAPGFSGNSFHGYELFFEALADQLLTPKRKRKKLVNIFGIVPFQHLFWKGELKTIKQILKDIGVEANVIFTEFDTLETLEKIPAAAYNLVLSPWVGHRAAKKLEEKFGTPFVSFPGPPVGPIQTTKFLRKVADLLDLPTKKVEDYIFKQERESYDLLEFGADAIIVYDPNSYFAVAADTNTAINITKYLTDEISALPEVIIITDDPPVEFRDQIIKEFESKEISFSPEIIFEKDTYKIQKHLENRSFSTLFASSIESAFANKLNKLHLTVTFPSYNRLVLGDNYVGYFGGTHFIENAKSIKLGPL
ncbi:MAG: nitrogenase, partial [Methanobrevibacter sp.]|nr:nitrogenase [Methanobrevibacter sp.]